MSRTNVGLASPESMIRRSAMSRSNSPKRQNQAPAGREHLGQRFAMVMPASWDARNRADDRREQERRSGIVMKLLQPVVAHVCRTAMAYVRPGYEYAKIGPEAGRRRFGPVRGGMSTSRKLGLRPVVRRLVPIEPGDIQQHGLVPPQVHCPAKRRLLGAEPALRHEQAGVAPSGRRGHPPPSLHQGWRRPGPRHSISLA